MTDEKLIHRIRRFELQGIRNDRSFYLDFRAVLSMPIRVEQRALVIDEWIRWVNIMSWKDPVQYDNQTHVMMIFDLMDWEEAWLDLFHYDPHMAEFYLGNNPLLVSARGLLV